MGTRTFWTNHRFTVRTEKASAANNYKSKYEDRIARVGVHIDLDRIFLELGAKAIHNRSRKSKALGGAVVVVIREEQAA